ncbi:hypothetical protein SAMN05216188_101868 [Lentzea xinjiangensis]|uniref:Uncharacterized protein n=1 Tax=Lentzea xinjiangensis TaxID=402600 RepID=A0A1H9BNT4_9PSEU|nr:hypothetical protein [Lentzea xinjiangensis]SEP90654.1 hypothetical protein SAMN05216188_101868 [Lentzea xinjiangensis]
MSIEDHRRRLNGTSESTGQLSVAELIARREAETVEFPVITDDITPEAFEPTIKFKSVKAPGSKPKKQPMRELHITELLRREGRTDDTQRGGFTVGKLAVAASGGVVLCGSMAFGASSWLSSPDERPLAEVRFDERAQARGASAGTEGVVKLPSNKTQQADATETEQAEPTTDATTRVAPYVQQKQQQQKQRPAQQTPAPAQTQQPTQQPTSEAPPVASTPSTPTETSRPSTPPSTQTPPPPSSTSGNPPSSSTPPSSTPPSSNPLPTPANPVDVSVDLGLLDPVLNTVGDAVGGFDFFAPAN